MELTIVRENLMTRKGYSPYCGNDKPWTEQGGCRCPRTIFNGTQFICPECGWKSSYPKDFIDRYKAKWNISIPPQK